MAGVINMLPMVHAALWEDTVLLVPSLRRHIVSSMLDFVLVGAYQVPFGLLWFARCVLLMVVMTHGKPPAFLIYTDG
jgi:hypothetical protein